MSLFSLFRRAAAPPPPPPVIPSQVMRVGGRLIDSKDWSPEAIEAIRKEYFLPSFKEAFFVRVDLTAGCPEKHITTESMGLIGKKPDFVRGVLEQLHRLRIKIQCTTCGKMAVITGRHVVWQGDASKWDGAT